MKKISFLLCICAALFCAFNSQSNKSHPEVANNGVHIDYTDTRKGDTTLLFVHGWCINKTYFEDQAACFKNHYRVVTVDLAGYGRSGKSRSVWNVQSFATDVDAIIKQLHLKNVVLIGHSMAGDIVMESAIHNPKNVIAIIGIDNFKNVGIINKDSVTSKQAYASAIYQLKHHFKAIANLYVKQDLFYKTTPLAVRTRVLNDVAQADSAIAAASLEDDHLDEAVELKKAAKPLFMINSDVHPTDTLGLHENHILSRLYYVHASGHFPMVEKPNEFNKCLAYALADLRSLGNHSPKR